MEEWSALQLKGCRESHVPKDGFKANPAAHCMVRTSFKNLVTRGLKLKIDFFPEDKTRWNSYWSKH